MIPLTGWEKTYTVYPEGVHPVSEKCALNMVSDQLSGEKIYVTLQLWKKNEKRGFTSKELTPVKSVNVSEDKKQVTVRLASGEIERILRVRVMEYQKSILCVYINDLLDQKIALR